MDRARSPMRPSQARARNLLRDRRGGTAIEYGLIIALIVLSMMAALNSVASTTTNMWNRVSRTVLNVT